MRLVTNQEYEEFLRTHPNVTVEGVVVRLEGYRRVKQLQPDDFRLEVTTEWSFPKRGAWATHKANYRGNWAPQIPRNLILRYTQPGDLVLDQMVGGGTTLVECKLLGRRAIGVDVNLDAVMLTKDRLNFYTNSFIDRIPEVDIKVYEGDARHLDVIEDETIDLIATHPPYANIIKYSHKSNANHHRDLSRVHSIEEFVGEMRKVAQESYRVLKPGHHCAILVGDTRRHKHHVPIAFRVMQAFLDVGFILREDVIKHQWNTKTEGLWRHQSEQKNFLLLMHEHLFVFRKPDIGESTEKFRESMKWW